MSEQSGNFDISKQGSTPDLVTELVGEGKKFKTVEDLAKGKLESDVFIDRLKTENKALREALDTEGNPDEVLNRITALLNSKNETKNTTTQSGNQSTKESLSKDEVLELLSERERSERAKNNVTSFNAFVNKTFGEKAEEVVKTRLNELSMDGNTFTSIVATNPQAALRMIGVTSESHGAASASGESSVNTAAYFGDAGKGNGEKQNFAYFQKMRRELGEKYYTPEVQKQVFESRKKLGDAFWK